MTHYTPFIEDNGVFTPELMLPVQFGDLCRHTELTPERKLLLAILSDALQCFCGTIGVMTGNINGHGLQEHRKIRMHTEAARWIAGIGEPAFTFKYCCENLNLDPIWIRQLLIKRPAKPVGIIYRDRMRVGTTKLAAKASVA
jgi:hypothetical protein